MTRKKYETEFDEDNHEHDNRSVDYDSDYDSEKEFLETQSRNHEEFKQETFEEKESLRWWDELTNYPELYHLRKLSYSWFEDLLEYGFRPEQFQVLFKERPKDYLFKPVPPHLVKYGITQEIWELIC